MLKTIFAIAIIAAGATDEKLPPDLNQAVKVKSHFEVKILKGSRLFLEIEEGKWKQFGENKKGLVVELSTPLIDKGNKYSYRFMVIHNNKRLIKTVRFKGGENKKIDFTDLSGAETIPAAPTNP